MGIIRRLILVVLTIVLTAGVCFVFRYIPGGADFLSNFFWNLLGEIEIFGVASNILQTSIGYQHASSEQLALTVFTMAVDAMMDGLVMGCCVFALRAVFARVTRQFVVIYPGGAWLPTGLGVALGAFIMSIAEFLGEAAEVLLPGVLSIALMIWGIIQMLNKRPVRVHWAKRRENNVVRMLFDILGNAVAAVSAVLLATCALEGPRLMMEGASFRAWFGWLCGGFMFWFFLDSVLWILTPRD